MVFISSFLITICDSPLKKCGTAVKYGSTKSPFKYLEHYKKWEGQEFELFLEYIFLIFIL